MWGDGVLRVLLMVSVFPTIVVLVAGWLTLRPPGYDDAFETRRAIPRQLVAVDSSGHGNDGAIQGRPVLGLAGHRGTAYSFENPGSWVQVASDKSLNPGSRDFLFSAWVRFAVAPAEGESYDIVRKGLSWTRTGEFKVEVVPGGRVKCSTKDGRGHIGRVIDAEAHVTDGQWHQIGCARTGKVWSVLVDKAITSKVVNLGSISNTMPLSLGSKYGQEDMPRGLVDEVRLVVADPLRDTSGRPVETRRARLAWLRSSEAAGWWRFDEAAPSRPAP